MYINLSHYLSLDNGRTKAIICTDVKHNEEVAVVLSKIPEQIEMFRNRDVKVQAWYSAALPCKTLLELTVGWAAGVLARDTTFAMTGVESFLKEGGPEEEAGAMERFAGHSGQKKMRISSKIIEKKSISETTPTLQICLQMKEAAV